VNIRALFPTQIGELEPISDELRSDLETAIWMVEDGDGAGHEWCEREGYAGYTSYASLNDLTSRATAFAELNTQLDGWAMQFAKAQGWDLNGRRLLLDAMWVNILGEGGSHSGHIHPGSVISGTTYVSIPEHSGALRFEDPRLPMKMAAPPLVDSPTEDQSRFIYIAPKPGMTLMWESWLRHEVMEHKSAEPRLSISFNYGLGT